MPDYQEPDYKELYLKLFRATEETINRLIEVQQQCEELYLAAGDHETDSPSPMIYFGCGTPLSTAPFLLLYDIYK